MKLETYLTKNRLSAYAFANQLGVSRAIVGQWLSGAVPGRKNILRIAEETNGKVTVKDFYEGAA